MYIVIDSTKIIKDVDILKNKCFVQQHSQAQKKRLIFMTKFRVFFSYRTSEYVIYKSGYNVVLVVMVIIFVYVPWYSKHN